MAKYQVTTNNLPYPKGTIIEIDYKSYPVAVYPNGERKEVRVMSEKHFQGKGFKKLVT
jgi:hypothetical protein